MTLGKNHVVKLKSSKHAAYMSTLVGFLICCVELLQLVLLTCLGMYGVGIIEGAFGCTCDWKISHRVFCQLICILKGYSCKWNVWTLVWARCICLAGQPTRAVLLCLMYWSVLFWSWSWFLRPLPGDSSNLPFAEPRATTECEHEQKGNLIAIFCDAPFSWNCFLQWVRSVRYDWRWWLVTVS